MPSGLTIYVCENCGMHGWHDDTSEDRSTCDYCLLPVISVSPTDERTRSQQYVEDGQRLIVVIGNEPHDDDVRTQSGIPIRGVTRVTIEDDVQGGRAVVIRLRDYDLSLDLGNPATEPEVGNGGFVK